jgi:hypothetical protein
MSEEWGAPEGANGTNNKPFDRNALAASLADVLKDVSAYGDGEAPPPAPAPARAPLPGPGAAKVPNPFGRPNAPIAPAPAPLASPPSVAPRTGPSILSGGISSGPSGMGGLGGSTVSAFRSPEGGGIGLGASGGGTGATGFAPRPLGPLGGMSTPEPREPAATITLKRNRPEPESGPVPAAAAAPVAAPAPPRPVVPMAGWTAADDDILPHPGTGRRRTKGSKAAKVEKSRSKAAKTSKVAEAGSAAAPGQVKQKRFRLK